jgi:hypothetical protein
MYFATKQQAVVNVNQERDKTIIYGMQWNAGRQEHILSFGLRLWTEGITGKKRFTWIRMNGKDTHQKEYLLNHTAPHSEYYVLHA